MDAASAIASNLQLAWRVMSAVKTTKPSVTDKVVSLFFLAVAAGEVAMRTAKKVQAYLKKRRETIG